MAADFWQRKGKEIRAETALRLGLMAKGTRD